MNSLRGNQLKRSGRRALRWMVLTLLDLLRWPWCPRASRLLDRLDNERGARNG